MQARSDYYRTQVRPLAERTATALREAFQDRAITAYELNDLLESLARMELSDLELRYEHQRLRTRLEILLECRLSQLAGESPAAAARGPPHPARPALAAVAAQVKRSVVSGPLSVVRCHGLRTTLLPAGCVRLEGYLEQLARPAGKRLRQGDPHRQTPFRHPRIAT